MNYNEIEKLDKIAESCYLCKNARCTKHCPISTPIPQVIALYKEGALEEAGKLLFENNPLSAVCGIVCPHEKTCYGNCIRGIKDDPVKFYEIEAFISSGYLAQLSMIQQPPNGYAVAIIGSGPAGISLAMLLAEEGYEVTLFEMHPEIGGVLRYGIPEFRLPRHILQEFEKRLIELGVHIRYNTLVGPVITLDKLLADEYDAVFIGTGVWNPVALDIKGETLGHVHYAIDYLREPKSYKLGKKVVVVGAGNVAMDAARTARYYGSEEVTIVYRKDETHMPAIQEEIVATKEDGVKFTFFNAPVEITKQGLVTIETTCEKDEQGGEKWKSVQGSEKLIEADAIIIAVSQGPKTNIVAHTDNLETTDRGNLVIDAMGRTTKQGVFASGDVVTGAKTVVEAVAASKLVAQAIKEYCESKVK